MQSLISGTTLPVLELILDPGEVVVSPPGELAWMTPNMRMQTSMAAGGASGLWGALTRAVAGGGLFMTEFSPEGGSGGVAFTAKIPGQIVPVEVQNGRGYMIHRHGFLAGTAGAVLTAAFQRSLGGALFGGEGFVLQHLSGTTQAWVALGGEIVTQDLQPGETLMVHPGHVGMFEDSVSFDITTVPGIKNMLFGGDGIFLVQLTGPGRIWLQTMTLANMAHALAPYLPGSRSSSSSSSASADVGTGSIMRGIFGDDR